MPPPTTPHAAVPLLTASPSISTPPGAEPPAVLSYFAMRRAAGYIGLILPPVVVFFNLYVLHAIPRSISASYYTGTRNFFVGSLCAIGIFLITSIGYKADRTWSIFAGALAFVVAFCPTYPDPQCQLPCPDSHCIPPCAHIPFTHSPAIHTFAAVLLFLTFAWFCLILFTRSPQHPHSFTPRLAGLPRQKQKRNVSFIGAGCTMLVFMGYYLIVALRARFFGHPEPHYSLLIVEWVCLWAFAFAWLVKGQQMFKD